MDTLTHALSGALLARATAPARRDAVPLPRRVALGTLAAAFPDIDFITSYLSPLAYLYHHRGVTHSLLMLPLWAILVGVIFAAVCRDLHRWRQYVVITGAGVAIHILGDVITAFGTMIYAPVSDARVAWSTTFIIDLWFTGIIILGLLASAWWRSSRLPAMLGLAILTGYVGFQYLQQQRAIAFGHEYAAQQGFANAAVSASPRPVSPFNWMIIVEERERYHYALVNLVRAQPRTEVSDGFIAKLDAPYLPLDQAVWVHATRFGEDPVGRQLAQEAWAQESFAFFRWFSAYPALLRVDAGNPETCAWFHDLRFFTPGRGQWPFRYGLCRREGGEWRPYRLLTDEMRVPVY